MNKTTRILTTTLAGLLIASGAGFAGYQLGQSEPTSAETIRAAQCAAVEGLSLDAAIPFAQRDHECVWRYQVTRHEWIERGLKRECVCG